MGKCSSHSVCLNPKRNGCRSKLMLFTTFTTLNNFKVTYLETKVKFKDTQMKNNITPIFDHKVIRKMFSLDVQCKKFILHLN